MGTIPPAPTCASGSLCHADLLLSCQEAYHHPMQGCSLFWHCAPRAPPSPCSHTPGDTSPAALQMSPCRGVWRVLWGSQSCPISIGGQGQGDSQNSTETDRTRGVVGPQSLSQHHSIGRAPSSSSSPPRPLHAVGWERTGLSHPSPSEAAGELLAAVWLCVSAA